MSFTLQPLGTCQSPGACQSLDTRVDALCARIPQLAQRHPDLPTFLARFAALASPLLRDAGRNRRFVRSALLQAGAQAHVPVHLMLAALAEPSGADAGADR